MSLDNSQIWELVKQVKTNIKNSGVLNPDGTPLFGLIDGPLNSYDYNKPYVSGKVTPIEILNNELMQIFISEINLNISLLIIKQKYNPTTGLPINPSTGDIFLSLATKNGWIINNLYRWDGSTFVSQSPITGLLIWNKILDILSIYDGSVWVDISGGSSTPQINSDWNATSGVAEILNKPIAIPGTGVGDLPILRLGCSTADNVVRIQTSIDLGVTWIDTDSIVYIP